MSIAGFKVLMAQNNVLEVKTLLRLLLLCGISLLPSACSKKTGSSTESVSEVSASSGSGVQPGAAEMESALRELTQALRKYSIEHKQKPKAFSELVAAGYVQHLPQAPPGKKFEIDSKTMQVVLVKQ